MAEFTSLAIWGSYLGIPIGWIPLEVMDSSSPLLVLGSVRSSPCSEAGLQDLILKAQAPIGLQGQPH